MKRKQLVSLFLVVLTGVGLVLRAHAGTRTLIHRLGANSQESPFAVSKRPADAKGESRSGLDSIEGSDDRQAAVQPNSLLDDAGAAQAGLSAFVASYIDESRGNAGSGNLTTLQNLTGSPATGANVTTTGVNAEVVAAPNGQFAITYPTGEAADSISIISGLNQSTPAENRVIPMGDLPNAVAITADSTTAIVVNALSQPTVTYRIITGLPNSPSVSNLFSIPSATDTVAEDVALSPSGNTAVITLFHANQVVVIDGVRSGFPNVRTTIPVGAGPNGVAFKPDGNTAFVANTLDNSIEVIAQLNPGGAATSINRIRTGAGPNPQAIQLTPDGTRALVTNTGGNTVSLFQVFGQSLTPSQVVTVGQAPAGLAISSDGQMAIAANSGNRTVSVIGGLGTGNPHVTSTVGPSPQLDTASFAEHSVTFTGQGGASPGTPTLSVSPTSLTFNDVSGQGNPPSQSITVQNTGDGVLTFSIGSSNSSLVTASPDNGILLLGQSTTVTVSVTNPNNIGTQNASLTVSAPGASNSPQVVQVTVNTSGPGGPVLDVTPTSLTFNDTSGQGNPPPQTIVVQNSGTGFLSFNITSSNSNLVTVSPSNGNLFGGQSATVTVFVTNPNSPGTQNAFLTVNAPGALNNPTTVSVTVNTSAGGGPVLMVAPTSLTFNAISGQGNPPTQTFTVQNTGTGFLNFNISSSNPNLANVSPSNGTLIGGQSATITVFVNNPNSIGTQTAFLTVSAAGASNSPQTVSVTVNTSGGGGPILGVAPGSMTFNDVSGQGNPPAQTLTISNSGNGPMAFNITSSNPNLVTTSPSSGNLLGGQSTMVSVLVTNPNTPGTQNATLSVAAPAAQNSPQNVAVTVNTSSGGLVPVLSVSTNALTFNPVVGQGNPPAQSITVANVGGLPTTFTIGTSNSSLVTASPNGGTLSAGQSIAVTVTATNPGTPGTQNATLTVAALGAQNSPQQVNVSVVTQSSPGPGGNNSPQTAASLSIPPVGQSSTVTGNAMVDDPGTIVTQLGAECQYGGPVQAWYRFTVTERAAFGASVNFTGADVNFDLFLFIQTGDTSHFPQGIQLLASSIQQPGQQESTGTRVLEPGTYYLGVARVRRNNANDAQRVNFTLSMTRGLSPEILQIEDVTCLGQAIEGATINGIFVVNRIRPTRYPARLEAIDALFLAHQGRPSPAGRTVRMIVFADASGSGTPPINPILLVDQLVTIPAANQFNRLTLGGTGPVINAGDFYVGYVVDTSNGIFPDAGRLLYPGQRSFASNNGGQSYQSLMIQDTTGQQFAVAIRATVNTQPFGQISESRATEGLQHRKVEMREPRVLRIELE